MLSLIMHLDASLYRIFLICSNIWCFYFICLIRKNLMHHHCIDAKILDTMTQPQPATSLKESQRLASFLQ